jgi:hypothetical protein
MQGIDGRSLMSLAIASSSSVSSVTLAMFRSEAGAPRRGDAAHGHDSHHRHAATPLADAMADALRSLGWVPQAPAATPAPATAPVAAEATPTVVPAETATETAAETPTATPEAAAPAADLPAAMADFAEALMAALREAGGGRGRGRDRDGDGVRDNGDNGRRAWGYGRAVGVITVRLERVIGELKAAMPAPTPAPTTEPTPVEPPAPTSAVDTAAPAPEAGTEPAAPATIEPAPTEPVAGDPTVIDAAPAPAPAPAPAVATSPLADAFAQLLDALRDNGADVPADGDPAAQMIEFLQALSSGLKPDGGGTSTVTGLFIRISV